MHRADQLRRRVADAAMATPAYEVSFAPPVPRPQWLDPRTWVNGEGRRDSNTADKVFAAPSSVNPT